MTPLTKTQILQLTQSLNMLAALLASRGHMMVKQEAREGLLDVVKTLDFNTTRLQQSAVSEAVELALRAANNGAGINKGLADGPPSLATDQAVRALGVDIANQALAIPKHLRQELGKLF